MDLAYGMASRGHGRAARMLSACALLLGLCAAPAFSSAFNGGGIISLDFRYMDVALKNNGLGMGVGYEHTVTSFCSLRGTFSHVSLFPTDERDWVLSVGIGIDARIYPLNKGMHRLYFGFGVRTDFLMFSQYKDASQNYTSWCPQIGWKENFLDYVMVEAFLGYRLKITDASSFALQTGLARYGFEFGLSVHLNLPKIFRWMFRRTGDAVAEDA